MGTYYNLSYFIGSLPDDFNSWNNSYRLSYYQTHLREFDYLGGSEQAEIAQDLSREDIQTLHKTWQEENDVIKAAATGNTTYFLVYLQDTLMTTPQTIVDLCSETILQDLHNTILILMLGPAALAIALLMMVRSRKHLWLSCCWGRPSVIYPVNFVDEYGRRWAYAACFAIMTRSIVDFFNRKYIWKPGYWEDKEWDLRFGWLESFILVGNVFHLGFLFYPLFACVAMRRHIAANIMGLLYLVFWIYFDVSVAVYCPVTKDPDTNTVTVKSAGELAIQIPIFLGELVTGFCFILDFCINVKKMCQASNSVPGTTKKRGKETLPLLYIQTLLLRNKAKPTSVGGKLKHLFTYARLAGFKYSPRVVCTMVVAAIGLYVVSFTIAVSLDEDLRALQTLTLHSGILESFISNDTTELLREIPRYVIGVRWSIFLSNVVSAVLHGIFMVHMIITYRRDMRRKLRGDHTWHFKVDISPASCTVAGMRYSGYQIGYLIYGYIIMFIVLAVVTVTVTVFIIVPLTFRQRTWLIDKIIRLAPTVAIGLFLYFIQVLLARFCFLQERGKYIALDNRRLYHMASFFVFFFNIVLGLFSVLKRTLLSLIFGTLMISRLDRCLMMRGFESFDTGFKAYLGMLTIDVYHNHPILKGFIYILRDEVRESKEFHKRQEQEEAQGKDGCVGGDLKGSTSHRFNKNVRNKWWKIITLVNNPMLVLERLQKEVNDNKAAGHPLQEGTIETIANAGAIMLGGVIVTSRSFGQSVMDNATDLLNTTTL